MYKPQMIFSGTLQTTPAYYGWSTVIRTSGEKLLAVCSGGREAHICPFGRVHLFRSDDGGQSWQEPELLSNGPLDDRDAGLCQTADGRILMNYFTNVLSLARDPQTMPEHWQKKAREITLADLTAEHGYWMRYSDDGGATWSPKYPTPVNNPHGPALLKDGSLLMLGRQKSSSFAYMYEGSRMGETLAAAKSVDNGETWEVISSLPVPEGHSHTRCFEPYAIETDDGRIIAIIRDQHDFDHIESWQIESFDGGVTWSKPHVVCNGYPSHLLKFDHGKLLLSYGYRNAPYGVRCRISQDNGENWSDEFILYKDGKSNDLGYPTTAVMEDGTFFTMWYEAQEKGGSALKYCRWQLEI